MTLTSDEIATVLRPTVQASCLPPRAYTDYAILNLEKQASRHSWVGIGRSDRLGLTNSYLADVIADVPILLTRSNEGVLRGFANTCRHRGSKIVDDGAGDCRRITCPMHGWTYGLDGHLVAAGHMESAEHFDKADHGLIPIAVAEKHGFLFVNVAGDAGSVDSWLSGFDAIHSDWPLETLVSVRRKTFEVGCNWKLFLEIFNEYYHLSLVHKGTIGGLYARPETPEFTDGSFATQFGLHGSTGSVASLDENAVLPHMPGLSGQNANGTRYTWIFPNMAFAASVDCAWSIEAQPITPDRTQCATTVMFPKNSLEKSGADALVDIYLDRMDRAMDEDIIALERQQAGLASPLARAGRFSPTMEPNVHAFQKWWVQHLQRLSKMTTEPQSVK